MKKEFETLRHNLTAKAFYNYCVNMATKKGLDPRNYLEFEDWEKPIYNTSYHVNKHEDWNEPKTEVIKHEPFQAQFYLEGAYNFIMEYDGEIGYCYIYEEIEEPEQVADALTPSERFACFGDCSDSYGEPIETPSELLQNMTTEKADPTPTTSTEPAKDTTRATAHAAPLYYNADRQTVKACEMIRQYYTDPGYIWEDFYNNIVGLFGSPEAVKEWTENHQSELDKVRQELGFIC